MDALLAKDTAPPEDRLDAKAKIASPADIDRALGEISWIDSRQQTVDSIAAKRIELIKSEAAGKLVIDEVPFAARRRQLDEAIRGYVDENPELVFEDGSKTRAFTHGKLAFRDCPAGVEYVDGKAPKDAIAKIEANCKEKGGFAGLFKRILAKIVAVGEITAERFLRVKVEIDKTAINKAWKDGEVSKSELRSLGMRGVAAGETATLSIEVHEYQVRSEVES